MPHEPTWLGNGLAFLHMVQANWDLQLFHGIVSDGVQSFLIIRTQIFLVFMPRLE